VKPKSWPFSSVLDKSDFVRFFSLAVLGTLIGWARLAGATAPASTPRPTKATASLSFSIGSPNQGRLDNGKRLTSAPYLRVVPYYAESTARWGLPSLVGLIDRAAKRVARRYPDAVLSVGDLSRREGGELERHHSHKSGRDADLGFYLRNAADKPLLPARFVTFSARGEATDLPGAVFDDARNWALVEALLDDHEARVSHIFVARHIRARLLRYAEKHGVASDVRQRAADVMMQPSLAAHDDHFHVRIGCPPDQRRCIEYAILRTPRPAADMVRVRMQTGSERMLPVLPRAYPATPGPSSVDDPDDADPAASVRASPLGRDHVGKRPLSKEDEADNLER
jgi:penicillin-insensitive murein endopeptidase